VAAYDEGELEDEPARTMLRKSGKLGKIMILGIATNMCSLRRLYGTFLPPVFAPPAARP
jgi:hypothetical protein